MGWYNHQIHDNLTILTDSQALPRGYLHLSQAEQFSTIYNCRFNPYVTATFSVIQIKLTYRHFPNDFNLIYVRCFL